MEKACYSCPQWNDWKGKCDAPYWCPDRQYVEERYENSEDYEERKD